MKETFSPAESTTDSCQVDRRSFSLFIVASLAITSLLHLYIPYPIAEDTAYHFAVGQLLKKYGILHSFPWTQFSSQFDHYADKEFLFHLLFVPLGGFGYVNASRVVGIFCGTLILAALYLVLRSEKVRYAGIWALLPLGMYSFVSRFAQVRPHLLSITLALIIVWAYTHGRLRILAIAAVIYPLSYVAFWQIPLILLVAAETARFLAGERFRWQPAAIMVTGLVIGLAVHPNTYNLLSINWMHMYDILFQNAWGKAIGIELGGEFAPYQLDEWVRRLSISVVMAGTAAVLAWRGRRNSPVPLAYAVSALIFLGLTIASSRFQEYFVPFSVLALAVATRSSKSSIVLKALLGITMLYNLVLAAPTYRNMGSMETKIPYMNPVVAYNFAKAVPPGSHIYTCGWDYTGTLMVALPDRYFMVAADPTMFHRKDPLLYEVWSRLIYDAPPDSAEIIRSQFKCRYAICPQFPLYFPLMNSISSDPGTTATISNDWVLFDLEAAPNN